jgi:drug/metabolite transporter (DMT)-like permease
MSEIPSAPLRPAAHASLRVGVRHMVAAAFYFSLMSLLVKLAGDRLPASQLVLARAVVCLFLSWLWLRRVGLSPWGSNPRMLLLRGLAGTVGLFCFYYALTMLPLAEAVVILHMAPIFTAILAAVALSEPINRRLIVAILFSACGVLAIVRPEFLFGASGMQAAREPWGLVIGFIGALASACAYVLVRRIGDRENPLVTVFYFPLVTLPISLPIAAVEWLWPTPLEWLMLLGLGVTTQLAQVHMTRGLALVPAGRATTIGYFQVVLAALWGVLIFGEVPDLLTLAGAALVLAGTFAATGAGFGRRRREQEAIVRG